MKRNTLTLSMFGGVAVLALANCSKVTIGVNASFRRTHISGGLLILFRLSLNDLRLYTFVPAYLGFVRS